MEEILVPTPEPVVPLDLTELTDMLRQTNELLTTLTLSQFIMIGVVLGCAVILILAVMSR